MDPQDKPPDPPEPHWLDEGLEFELTDFEDARRVLDNESISQFDVATTLTPEQLNKLRRPLLPTDRALNGKGIDWLLSFSPDLRPDRLGLLFPRVANALADVWHDPDERQGAVERLLGSERKNRKGFPPDVKAELAALRRWMEALRGWDQPF